MSLTLGIMIRQELNEKQRQAINGSVREVMDQYGYGLSEGVEACEEQVKPGMREVARSFETDFFLFLHDRGLDFAEAGTIGDGLRFGTNEEQMKTEPLEMFQKVDQVLERFVGEYYWIYCVEDWEVRDWVKLWEGSFEEYVTFLKRPCGWTFRHYNMTTGCFQCDSGYAGPKLVFRITTRGQA